MTKTGSNKKTYSAEKAGQYWSQRVKEVDPLAAVLTYNAPPEINRSYDRWERSALLKSLISKSQKPRQRSALDLGCGIGRLSLLLAEQGYNVTAVDLSEEMLLRCRKRIAKNNVLGSVEFVHSSSHNAELSNRRYNIITCFGLLEHLPPRERSATMRHAFAHLASRGRMFVVVNNAACLWLDKRYHLKGQRSDGYFAGMVGVDWLQKLCRRHNMKSKIVASNPLYAIAHYCLSNNKQVDSKYLKRFVNLGSEIDLMLPPESSLSELAASHFMMEIRHNHRR